MKNEQKQTPEQKTTRIERRIVGWLRESLDTACQFRRLYLMGRCKLALAKLDKLNGLQRAGKGAR